MPPAKTRSSVTQVRGTGEDWRGQRDGDGGEFSPRHPAEVVGARPVWRTRGLAGRVDIQERTPTAGGNNTQLVLEKVVRSVKKTM
jgi:hypothetical protein